MKLPISQVAQNKLYEAMYALLDEKRLVREQQEKVNNLTQMLDEREQTLSNRESILEEREKRLYTREQTINMSNLAELSQINQSRLNALPSYLPNTPHKQTTRSPEETAAVDQLRQRV